MSKISLKIKVNDIYHTSLSHKSRQLITGSNLLGHAWFTRDKFMLIITNCFLFYVPRNVFRKDSLSDFLWDWGDWPLVFWIVIFWGWVWQVLFSRIIPNLHSLLIVTESGFQGHWLRLSAALDATSWVPQLYKGWVLYRNPWLASIASTCPWILSLIRDVWAESTDYLMCLICMS